MPGENPDVKQQAVSSTAPAATSSETPPAQPAPSAPAPGVPASKPAAATTPDTTPVSSSPTTSAPAQADGKAKGDATPDAVQEAVARLTGKPVKPAPPKPDAKAPVAPPGPVRAPDGKFAPAPKVDESAKATVEEAPAQKPDLEADPLNGFADDEKSSLKSKTRERITGLHQKWREAETARATLEKDPALGLGKEWTKVIESEELGEDIQFVKPEHLGGLVRVQAALNRAELAANQGRDPSPEDAAAIKDLLDQSTAIAKRFGLAPAAPAAASPEITPFTGQLSAEYQDMVELYGMSEADVRLLAGIKARMPPGQQQRTPVAAQQPAPVAPPAPPQERPRGVDMNRLYAQRLGTTLVNEFKVPPDRINAHMAALMPVAKVITKEMFPTVSDTEVARVFDSLSPKDRFDILMKAQQRSVASSQPQVPSVQPLPQATTNAPLQGRAPAGTPPPTDAVAAAKQRLIQGF